MRDKKSNNFLLRTEKTTVGCKIHGKGKND
jgi:hypothetical protein